MVMQLLDADAAANFSAIALSHVGREYPNKLDHVLAGPEDARTPRALHAIFFGSFDWHSCVHAHWLLARVARRVQGLAARGEIEALFAARFTPEHVAAELAYLARPESRGFERPYGWAWLLALQAELERHPLGAVRRAADALRPLARAFAERFKRHLPLCAYPVRAGTHANTAFALRLAAYYAASADPELMALLREKALAWYGADRNCQAWEPSQDDFLSPALIEAECMRRLMSADEFNAWILRFLPRIDEAEPATLFTPVSVSDRGDGKIVHLDGLNLSRAWCWRAFAAGFAWDSPLAATARETAERHIEASLPHIAGDYAGAHWLASFALLALDGLD